MLAKNIIFICFLSSAVATSESCDCEETDVISECFQLLEGCEEIKLLGNEYTLKSTINYSNENNLAIMGAGTTIQCVNESSGFVFHQVTNLEMNNMTIKNCGVLHTEFKATFKVAVLITETRNVIMTGIRIAESEGTGLGLLNIASAHISNSSFESNTVGSSDASGGGGVYLEHALSTHSAQEVNVTACEVRFVNCWFVHNVAEAVDLNLGCDDRLFSGIGHGGGISICLRDHPCSIDVTVENSTISNNTAESGGAVELVLFRAKNNVVNFTDLKVLKNKGDSRGGGGISIKFSASDTYNNLLFVTDTIFQENVALYGGGACIITHSAYDQSQNAVNFRNCLWIKNSAHYASAIDIFPAGVLDGWTSAPLIVFEDCTFESNYKIDVPVKGNVNIYRLGEGVVMLTGFIVAYRGNVNFLNNSGSSIYAVSSMIKFESGVSALFHSNSAEMGAGLALVGFSALAVGNNSSVTFLNNTVSRQGAAIYYFSTDKHVYVHNKRCLIQKLDESVSNVTFNFIGNRAPKEPFYKHENYVSSSIFSSASLTACCESMSNCTFGDVGKFLFFSELEKPTQCENITASEASNCSGTNTQETNFTSNVEDSSEYATCSLGIDTHERHFSAMSGLVYAIPGFLTKLPLCGSMNTTFDVSIEKSSANKITAVKSHFSIHNRHIILHGNIGERASLSLTEQSTRKYFVKFEIELDNCPPLYKLSDSLSCTCYSNGDTPFLASFLCGRYKTSLRWGYWIGYAETEARRKKILYISYCPKNYCRKLQHGINYYPLPIKSSELKSTACGQNRQGVLCGECTENTTVYFYSRSFKCGGTEYCQWGPVFYLLSEILPLTILFLLVIFFNISFTSGDLNGFIFFAQMYAIISDTGEEFPKEPNLQRLYNVPHIIYSVFNLDYFGVGELSFCLWKNANTLSILAFKYLTVVYALGLVLGTILGIRMCSAYKCITRRKMRYSVIQGLSAFLVMAYSQCTEISFSILNPIYIYRDSEINSTVVFLQGNVRYFSSQHLPFAVPALLCILFFVALLPLILIYYPLCNKIVAFLGLEESRVVAFISRLVPMSRIKPLVDCFQGTFKDNCRFFAGLLFAYRAAILASRFAPTMLIIYAVMAFQLVIMLIVHTLAWPYQRRIHNLIDALLIADLAMLAILKVLQAELTKLNRRTIMVNVIELMLAGLPLLVLIIYAAYRITKLAKTRFKPEEDNRRDTKLLDALLLEEDLRRQSLNSSTDSYMLMTGNQSE